MRLRRVHIKPDDRHTLRHGRRLPELGCRRQARPAAQSPHISASKLIQPPDSPSSLTAAFQHRRNDDAELEQHEHRDQLEEGGHKVGAWQEQRESDNCDDRVAPVFA